MLPDTFRYNKKYYTKTATQWLTEDRVLYAVSVDQAKVSLEDAKENMKLRHWMRQDKDVFTILELKLISTTIEARQYYQEVISKGGYLAVALVAKNPVAKVIASFALGFNKPKISIPIAIFDDMDEAEAWITKLRLDNNND